MLEVWYVAVAVILFVFHVLGFISAVQAVLRSRTSQGAIAWSFALLTWPVATVPLFWIFGRNKFHGYVSARRIRTSQTLSLVEQLGAESVRYRVDLGAQLGEARVLERLARLPFIRGNDVRLLIDGEATFREMFAAIDRAQKYVLAEFFIVNDDELGREFKDHLIAAAKRGCRVFLLYDDVGSQNISRRYLAELESNGVQVTGMKTTRGWLNRFQLNFRNHRKIVIIDGVEGLVGGLNVGDEYVDRHARLTPWRDTHLIFSGPAVLAAQVAFVEDWHWATDEVPDLSWELCPAEKGDKVMFVLPSGPDDELETCGLFFTHAINSAQRRIWIASPYFVPNPAIMTSLTLAAMRGVDVRLIIPGLADKWFVKRAAMAYVPEVLRAGVKVYEYGKGFMHQKVVLVDDDVSVVGTANFDNRSFRLNFEISMIVVDSGFGLQVERMLETDFDNSTELNLDSFRNQSWADTATCKFARLFSPIL